MRISFIGLGAMGQPMALNMQRAGFEVHGFDVRPEGRQSFAAAGGRVADSSAAASRDAELIWLMVVNAEQARQVLFDDGALAASAPNAIVAAACTQAPAAAAALAERIAATGRTMLDCPVSGGVKGAQAAGLAVMCAGPNAVYRRAEPVLKTIGAKLFHVGEQAGQGSTAKMINQLLCGVHIAAAAEAMNVAERAGVPLQTMHDIISVSAGNSWMWGDRGPRMMQPDPVVTSAVDIFVKDLGIVLDQGRQVRQALPLASAAMQMFLAASGLGFGKADDSQVIRAYRALNGSAPKQ